MKMETGQKFIIFDQEWFFQLIRKILQNDMKSTKLHYDRSLNLSRIDYSVFESPAFMDEFKIADYQQVEFLTQMIPKLSFLMDVDIKDLCTFVLPSQFTTHITDIELDKIWVKNLEDCFQVSSFYTFFFELPNMVLVRIFNKFLKLFEVDYVTNEYLLFQEGCFNILIRHKPNKSNFQNQYF